MQHWKWRLAATTGLVTVLTASAAVADVVTLNTANFAGFTGPYAQVSYSLTGQVASFTFSALSNGTDSFLLVDSGSAGLSINSSSFTIGPITDTQLPGFSAPTLVSQGSGNEDGFGSFNLRIGYTGGYTSSLETISFSVTNTSLTLWNSISDVLTGNNDGNLAAAHVAVCTGTLDPSNNPCTTTSQVLVDGVGLTGFVTGNTTQPPPSPPPAPPPAVPEPPPLALFGTALIALALTFGRRRRPWLRG